jgi:hypothetical protein
MTEVAVAMVVHFPFPYLGVPFVEQFVVVDAFAYPCNILVADVTILVERESCSAYFEDQVPYPVDLGPLCAASSYSVGLQACALLI